MMIETPLRLKSFLNNCPTVLKNYLDSPIALAQCVWILVDSRHRERRLLKKIFLVSHRSTLCIMIYTIDIYIQDVSDLGRGKICAVLPEFEIFEWFNTVYSDI